MVFPQENNIQYKKNVDRIESIDALRGWPHFISLYIISF